MITVESVSSERLRVRLTNPVDPTGSLPEWAVSTGSRSDPPSAGWVEGSWAGVWSAVSERIDAFSPNVGAGQALDVAEGVAYDVWFRFSDGVSNPVERVGSISVR